MPPRNEPSAPVNTAGACVSEMRLIGGATI
jgi:hypothetical protein